MSKEAEFLVDVVKNASLLINDELIIKAKDDEGDLVTNFDYEIEKYIIDRIQNNPLVYVPSLDPAVASTASHPVFIEK